MKQFVLYFYFIAALLSSSLLMSPDNNNVIWYNKTLIHNSRYVYVKSYKSNTGHFVWQNLTPVIGGVCGAAIVTFSFLIFLLLLGVVICKKSEYIIC